MGTAVCVAGATKRTFSGLVERRRLTVLARAMGCLPMVVADGRRFGHPSHQDLFTVEVLTFRCVSSPKLRVRPSSYGSVVIDHNHTPHWTINPYCYVLSGHISQDIVLASGPLHLLHALMFHSERVRLLLGYADTRPSLSIWRGAVEQGSARLLTLCVWSLLSLPCSVSRFFLGVPVHPTSVLLQVPFGMPLGFP